MFSKTKVGVAAIITLISVLLIPVSGFAGSSDFALHSGISSLFGAAGETYFHYKTDLEAPSRVLLGTVVGSLPGLGKELTDNEFSGTDMAADVCGAFLGALIANIVNTRLKVNVERHAGKASVLLTYSF
ncbi:MAG: hypothetical protein P8Z71_13650 [Candidatus Sulfobium sp.]|jgi:hypothetical protein